MVETAQAKLARGENTEYCRAKLVTARFFMERILPQTTAQLARIEAGADSVMELPAEAF
jgi:acyl-CoA dehydrogenase